LLPQAVLYHRLSPASAGFEYFHRRVPGVPLRSTPGFMLTPASRVRLFPGLAIPLLTAHDSILRPGSPEGLSPTFKSFDRALKTRVRPVLVSLQRLPFRDFTAEEFLGRTLMIGAGGGVSVFPRMQSHSRPAG
jgi:hypothetical protein